MVTAISGAGAEPLMAATLQLQAYSSAARGDGAGALKYSSAALAVMPDDVDALWVHAQVQWLILRYSSSVTNPMQYWLR